MPPLIRFNGNLGGTQSHAGSQSVTFAIYSEYEGGAPLWMETQNVLCDDQGNFMVLLGATGNGIRAELFGMGETRWLGIRHNSESAFEKPSILLASVPCAMKAANAETLEGKPVSAFVLASDASDTKSRPSTMSGTGFRASAGTPNTLARFDVDGSGLIDSSIREMGGFVGVGTAGVPTSNLHIQGGNADVTFNFDNVGSGGRAYRWDSTNSGSAFGAGRLVLQDINAGGLPRFAVDANGNIGIGMVASSEKLDVAGNVKITGTPNTGNNLVLSGDGSDVTFTLRNNAAGGHIYRWSSTSNSSPNGAGALFLPDQSQAGRIRFYVSGSGQVGINTSQPAATLHVSGDGRFDGNLNIVGTGKGVVFPDGTGQSTANPQAVQVTPTAVTGNGPDVTFAVQNTGSGGHSYRWDSTASGSSFGGGKFLLQDSTSGGAARLVVASNGNFGIGVLSPAQKLEVDGGIRLNATAAKPVCDSGVRGTFWVTSGDPGSKDSVEVCAKDAANVYAWRLLY